VPRFWEPKCFMETGRESEIQFWLRIVFTDLRTSPWLGPFFALNLNYITCNKLNPVEKSGTCSYLFDLKSPVPTGYSEPCNVHFEAKMLFINLKIEWEIKFWWSLFHMSNLTRDAGVSNLPLPLALSLQLATKLGSPNFLCVGFTLMDFRPHKTKKRLRKNYI